MCLVGFENGKVHLGQGHRAKNQEWFLRRTEDGSIVILSALSGKCLDIEGRNPEKGAWLLVHNYHAGANQKFTFQQLEDGAYSITAKHSDLVLDCNSNDEGAWVTQWRWHGGDNQRWYVNPSF